MRIMRRKIFALAVAVVMLLGMIPTAFAQAQYAAEFSILGTAVDFENEVFSDGTTVFVPLEELCTYLKLSVTKEGDYYTVVRREKTAVVRAENMVCTLNGAEVELSAHPCMKDGVLYVPADFFEKCLGMPVSKSADGRSTDLTPNAYTIDIDANHAAAVSGANPDNDTLSVTGNDLLFEPGIRYPIQRQKSVYYLIDLKTVEGLKITAVNLGLYIAKGGNNNPYVNVVRTALWEKGNISFNNKPSEFINEKSASITLGANYEKNQKNFIYNSFDITALSEAALKEGGVLSVKVQGNPYSGMSSVPTDVQASLRGVGTQYAPKVYVTTEESFTFPVKKNDLKMSDASDYDDIKLLASLGIVTTEDEFPMNLTEAKISRGDFVKFAMRLKNDHRSGGSDAQHFSDVPVDNEYFKDVADAYAEGIVTGVQGSLFRPYDAITVNEACAVIGRILGYEEFAVRNGGYAQGYIKAATRVSLLSGAKNENGVLTYQGAVKMLINSLDAPMFVPNVFTSIGTVEYIFDEGTTVFTEYFDATQIKGTVTANEYSYCGGSLSVAGSNHIVIDGKELSLRYEGYKDFLGYEVKAYYNRDNELLYMGIKEGSVSTVDLSQVVSVSPENGITIKYEEDGNTRSISFSTGDVIYNGKVLPSYNVTKEKFEVDGGELVRLSNGRVIAKAYTDMIAYAINPDDEIISDKYDARGKVLNLANADYYTITDTDGNEIKLEDIKHGSVLSVAKSLDGKIVNIIVSEKKITGTIQSVTDSGNNTVLEIEGLSYKTANRHKNWTDKIAAGKSGTFYIDAFGKICDFESGEQENIVGYLIAMDYAGSGISKKLQAAIMVGTSEKYVLYTLADKVKINGGPKEGDHSVIRGMFYPGGSFEQQAILFSTDSDGKINKINTAVDATGTPSAETLASITDETLVKNYTLEGKNHDYYRNGTGKLADWFYWDIVKNPAVIKPTVPTAIDDFEVVSDNIYTASSALTGTVYTLGYDTPVAELVVLDKGKLQRTSTGLFGVVQKKIMKLNEDGEYVNTLHIQTAPGNIEVISVPDESVSLISGIEYGDIVSVTKDYKGELSSAKEYYDYDNHTIMNNTGFAHSNVSSSTRYFGGYAIGKKDGYVKLAENVDNVEAKTLTDFIWIDVASAGSLYRYTADGKYVDMQKATVDDILDYATVPYAPSGLLVKTNRTAMVTAFILDLKETEGYYKLTYDKNDGITAPTSSYPVLDSNGQLTITESNPSLDGHIFKGWKIKDSSDETLYKNGDKITITQDTVLEAQWKETTTLKFTFKVPEEYGTRSFTHDYPLKDENDQEATHNLSEMVTKAQSEMEIGLDIIGWKHYDENGTLLEELAAAASFTPADTYDETDTVGGTFVAKYGTAWNGKVSKGTGVPGTVNIDGKDYYEIYTPGDLAWFSNEVDKSGGDGNVNAILTKDIRLNLDGEYVNNWDSFRIGDVNNFKGIFDGNGKKIINYYENSSGKYSGLFEVINGATIKNLTLENAKVEWGYSSNNSGFGSVVCGRANGSSTFNNIHVSGSAVALSDRYFVGFGSILGFGGVGTSDRLTITDCSSSVNIDSSASTMAPVSGQTYIGVGGIVGMSERYTTLTNCTNSGTINAPKGQYVGGIMGYARRDSNKFVNCTNTGNITGYVKAHAIASGSPKFETCNEGGNVTVIPAN